MAVVCHANIAALCERLEKAESSCREYCLKKMVKKYVFKIPLILLARRQSQG